MNTNLKENIAKELNWTFARSSGPGGQHVNTTDTKARLSWSFQSSGALTGRQKLLIEKRLKNYIKQNTYLHLSCSTNRSREMNKKSCLEKLFFLIENIAFKKEKKRIATKPTRASKERRLKNKKVKSDIKKSRQKFKY